MPMPRGLLTLYVLATVAGAARPIPKLTQSFCDDNLDFQVSPSGGPVGTNMTYRLCMDVGLAASRMECTKGVPCPGGPEMAVSVYINGTMHTVTHDGNCTSKPCPGCAPPAGLPFSFLLIDGANGDASRGVATYRGTAQMDGQTVDHWQHDRGQIVKGMGIMSWFLSHQGYPEGHQCLLRTSYAQPGGDTGSRDFSGKRTVPAPTASFAVPKGCKPATEAQQLVAGPGQAFGDGY